MTARIYAESSGLKTSSGAIYVGRARLLGIDIIAAGADTTVVVYDNASAASGTELFKGKVLANAKSETYAVDVEAENGLYLSISGTGAGAIVRYRPL